MIANIINRGAILQRVFVICRHNRLSGIRLKSNDTSDPKDEPIKYSTSKASEWKAAYSMSGKQYFKIPNIQPPAILISLTIFMIYFCILREENDLDDWMREVEAAVPKQIEEAHLRSTIASAKKTGADVSFEKKRLEELVAKRNGKIFAT